MAPRIPTYYSYRTPHGPITIAIAADGIGVTHVVLGDVLLPGQRRASALANRTATELLEYFAGKRSSFDVPLAPQGTPFQLDVWREIGRIGYGCTAHASDVAKSIGKPGSHRAVGAAVHRNPLAVLVPDHRIVGSNGRPIGDRSEMRAALLSLERKHIALG